MSADIDGVLALVRPELQTFAGYSSARSSAAQGEVWLNANESAWANPADATGAAAATRSRSRLRCVMRWRRCTACSRNSCW